MSRASLLPPCFAAFPAAEACDVAARSGETGDETQPDRVSADAGEDDRDRRRGASCRSTETSPPVATIKPTLRPTRSAANAGSRS